MEGLQQAAPWISGMQSANNPAFAGQGIPAIRQQWDPWFDALEKQADGRDIRMPGGFGAQGGPPTKNIAGPWGGSQNYTGGLPTPSTVIDEQNKQPAYRASQASLAGLKGYR